MTKFKITCERCGKVEYYSEDNLPFLDGKFYGLKDDTVVCEDCLTGEDNE